MPLLSLIKSALTSLKEENNQVSIIEFNQLIAAEIKKQPLPFIYERLGNVTSIILLMNFKTPQRYNGKI